MNRLKIFVFLLLLNTDVKAQSLQTFHDFTAITILGDTISLSQYAGKKLLVVNTASYCGFTPQFADLQLLDSIYAPYNFEVLGFPCNDFGGQDPGEDSSILGFCTALYGVTFQMMSKISITAADTADVYKWLQLQSLNGVANAPVAWNFNKFCIDENGTWVNHFTQYTLPFDTAITNWITSGGVTGLQLPQEDFSVKILANPVKENMVMQFNASLMQNVSVTIYNIEGKLVSSSVHLPVNGLVKHSRATLSNGLYFVKVTSGQHSRHFKVCFAE